MNTGRIVNQLRLIGPSGANKVMAAELSRLARRAGIAQLADKPRKDGLGSIVLPFEPRLAALATRYHRTTSRVLWDLYESRATRLEPLYDDLVALIGADDRSIFEPTFSLSVQVRGEEHFAAGGRQLVGTVKNALLDALGRRGVVGRVDADNADAHVMVRVQPDAVHVSLDLAGRPMNQRGYRLSGATAPLRETLAAMLVMLARHAPRDEVLVDPMAGTGTIAIEAACMAQGRPLFPLDLPPSGVNSPSLRRAFEAPAEPLFKDTRACIVANEVDPSTHALIEAHAGRAGVRSQITTVCGDFRDLSYERVAELAEQHGLPPNRGLILCNPPYGERLDPDDLMDLYNDMGSHFAGFEGFRVGIFVANPDFEYAFGGQPRIKKPLSNARLPAMFYLYDAL